MATNFNSKWLNHESDPIVQFAYVRFAGDGGIVVGVDEVDMVRSPTNHENDNNKGKHFHNFLLVVPTFC